MHAKYQEQYVWIWDGSCVKCGGRVRNIDAGPLTLACLSHIRYELRCLIDQATQRAACCVYHPFSHKKKTYRRVLVLA